MRRGKDCPRGKPKSFLSKTYTIKVWIRNHEKYIFFKINPIHAYMVPTHVKCCWNNISQVLEPFRCISDQFFLLNNIVGTTKLPQNLVFFSLFWMEDHVNGSQMWCQMCQISLGFLVYNFVWTTKHFAWTTKHFAGATKHFVGTTKHFVGTTKHFVGTTKRFIRTIKFRCRNLIVGFPVDNFVWTTKYFVGTTKRFIRTIKLLDS